MNTHCEQVIPWQVDGRAVHHALIQEQAVHVVACIIVLLNVLAAACKRVRGSSEDHKYDTACGMLPVTGTCKGPA